jgi:iron(III) transport system ATP-binding protein
MTALTVRSLEKSFGSTHVLKGVDLDVAVSSLTAILGPSGCGKTTLLRLIAGFDRPDSGSIHFGEQAVFDKGFCMPAQHRRVGYVAQEGALFPHLDVAQNITFGLPRTERSKKTRVQELLELVGLDEAKAKRYPHELSGGQQQRVALARALAPNPQLVVLDEPFASLDAGLRESTGRAVLEALRATKATSVLVTHDQNEALSLADQVAVMREGKILQVDTPQNVYKRPVDSSIAEFVGAAILVPATVVNATARTVFGDLPIAGVITEGSVTALIRPEQVQLLPVMSASATHIATVREVRYYGHDAAVCLQLDNTDFTITARVLGEEAPELREKVTIHIDGPVLTFPAAQ